MSAPSVVEGQVWEKGDRRVRVVWASPISAQRRSINVRDVESGRFFHFSDEQKFTSTYTFIGNPLSDEAVLFRLTDLVRRTGVSDADRLVDALGRIVRSRRAAA